MSGTTSSAWDLPDDPFAAIDEAPADLRMASFVESMCKHGVVAGHPETLAALAADHRWAAEFAAVVHFPSPWFERGQLVTGSAIAEAAEDRRK